MATRNQNIWIPFADSMTALMLIFLLIVVLLFSIIPQKDLTTEAKLEGYEILLDELYNDLNDAFEKKQEEWGVRVLEDLTIKFENPNILFDRDSVVIKREFRDILDEFIPIYLSIIRKEKYEGRIKEIKVEGHTAATSDVHDTYIKTIELSQGRAREVLAYILDHPYFENLSESEKRKVIFLLGAHGFGYGRAIDRNNNLVYNTNNPISPNSRRIEFRIVTGSDDVLKELIEKNSP